MRIRSRSSGGSFEAGAGPTLRQARVTGSENATAQADGPMGAEHPAPRHGSSRTLFVYGGAERAIWLARGFFTGESIWKPLWPVFQNYHK